MSNGPGSGGRRERLSGDEAARLAEPIARLSASGLPLAPGLRAAALEMPPGRVRGALRSIASEVESGATLEGALEAQGSRFPESLKGLMAVGARTGDLGRTLTNYLGFVNVGEEIRRGLALNLAYPVIAVTLALGVLIFVCVTIVSSFEEIYRDFGVSLPRITMVLIGVSRVFEVSWRVLLEAAIGLGVLALFLRFATGKAFRRGLASRLPIVGSVWWNTTLAEFCHLLALMIESEVPLDESLRLAGDGVADTALRQAAKGMAADVAGGLSLSQAVLRQKTLPRGLARLLHWAEGHQSLPESLRMAGQIFEARARSQSKFAGAALTALAVLVLIVGIAAVVLGVLLPMFQLISMLSG